MLQREMEDPGLKIICLYYRQHAQIKANVELLPTALRLVACVEPPQQIPRSSESAVALSAGDGCYNDLQSM
jgi:hypothetical protein